MFDIEKLKSFKLPDLQQVAEQLQVDGYKKLKKGELHDAILEKLQNQPAVEEVIEAPKNIKTEEVAEAAVKEAPKPKRN